MHVGIVSAGGSAPAAAPSLATLTTALGAEMFGGGQRAAESSVGKLPFQALGGVGAPAGWGGLSILGRSRRRSGSTPTQPPPPDDFGFPRSPEDPEDSGSTLGFTVGSLYSDQRPGGLIGFKNWSTSKRTLTEGCLGARGRGGGQQPKHSHSPREGATVQPTS